MSEVFDISSLVRRYAFVDDCPTVIFGALMELHDGSLAERVAGVMSWRAALLTGQMPPKGGWSLDWLAEPARAALESLGIARFCEGQPELVDELLVGVIGAMVRRGDDFRAGVVARLRELEALERERLARDERSRAPQDKRGAHTVSLDDNALRSLRERATREVRGKVCAPDETLIGAWSAKVRAWSEIAEVFGDLGLLVGRGRDLSLGVLKHVGWHDLVRLHELVKKLPELRALVQTLGRLHASKGGPSVAEQVFERVRRVDEERREVRVPNVPAETRGIERSAELARMLPVEAAMLGHPLLRSLWHARRAERALLTWRLEGIDVERVRVERDALQAKSGTRPRAERGPIIAVVDTSGSMQGTPEQVAKALLLEALRTAHAEKRRCLLYNFSGPGQVVEHELDLTPEGVGRLLTFLGMSFGGGTDVTEVMSRVVSRLGAETWRNADMVIVSDGEWPATSELVSIVGRERERGTRFHGVQIGNRGRTGLHTICDPVHVFSEWGALCGWANRS